MASVSCVTPSRSRKAGHRVADGRRIGAGEHGSRVWQVKQYADFAEVLFRASHVDKVLTAVGQFAHNLESIFRYHVDTLAYCALLEQHGTGLHMHCFEWPIRLRNRGYQLDYPVGQRQHSIVMGRNHYYTVGSVRSACVSG